MSETPAKPRITFEVTEEQKQVLRTYLDYGMQRKVFSAIIDDVINMLERFGFDFVLYMLDRQFTYGPQMEKYRADRRIANTELSTHELRGPASANTRDQGAQENTKTTPTT